MSDTNSLTAAPPYKLSIIDTIADGWSAFFRRVGLAIGGNLLVFLILTFPILLISPGQTEYSQYDPNVILTGLLMMLWFLVLVFIAPPFTGGLYWFNLTIARDDNPAISRIFEGFKRYGKLFGLQCLVLLIAFAAAIPILIAVVISVAGSGSEFDETMPIPVVITTVVVFAVLFFIFLRFTLVYFVLMDDREIGLFDALRRSSSLIAGNYWRYLALVIVLAVFYFVLVAINFVVVTVVTEAGVIDIRAQAFLLNFNIPALLFGPSVYIMHAKVYNVLNTIHGFGIVDETINDQSPPDSMAR